MENLFTTMPNHLQHKPKDNTLATIKQLTYELVDIEQENSLLRAILASSSDPILITSAEMKIINVNPAWETLTGYTFDEVKDKNPRFLQSGKTPKHVYKKLWAALKQNQPFTTEEVIDKKKDGTEYQIYSTFFSVVKDGNAFYYVQIQHDITKRKQVEELRKEFLSAAAHELKTPITVLKLLSQTHIAKAKKQTNNLITIDELELIDRELNRLTRLIDDILDSSRFETGKLYLRLEQINLMNVVKNLSRKVKVVAKNHRIVIVKPKEDFFVIADRERIEQVLLNLISNAVKYSPEKTPITIAIKNINNHAVVSVADQGIGISKGKQSLIFDRYYQVKAKEKRGFGLGLYISQEIIKRHKGRMWVDSTVGKGSTFYFSLPLIEGAST